MKNFLKILMVVILFPEISYSGTFYISDIEELNKYCVEHKKGCEIFEEHPEILNIKESKTNINFEADQLAIFLKGYEFKGKGSFTKLYNTNNKGKKFELVININKDIIDKNIKGVTEVEITINEYKNFDMSKKAILITMYSSASSPFIFEKGDYQGELFGDYTWHVNNAFYPKAGSLIILYSNINIFININDIKSSDINQQQLAHDLAEDIMMKLEGESCIGYYYDKIITAASKMLTAEYYEKLLDRAVKYFNELWKKINNSAFAYTELCKIRRLPSFFNNSRQR